MIGLTSIEAKELLKIHGANEIQKAKKISALWIFIGQFRGPMILLLIVALAISLFLGEGTDAVAIGAILVLNAVIGFFQEYRAEKAVESLRSLTAPRARVLRDGNSAIIPAREIVPGDLLILEAGDVAAADSLLLESSRLQMNEAVLTGESFPVEKKAGDLPGDVPLAERSNRVFMGTPVTSGTATALVEKTGMKTELGKIADLLSDVDKDETPLQRRLNQVSRSLFFLCTGIVLFIALLGWIRGMALMEILMFSVSLAVAAVPEGFPVIVTIALSIGIQRMAARQVLVRKLPAVETLGCTTVICTDKTGTLTSGLMVTRDTWGADERELVYAAVACCDAELNSEVAGGGVGDSTEVALLLKGKDHGIFRDEIEKNNPRISVIPFDSTSKWMSVSRADGKIYLKGALEAVLPKCVSGTAGAAEATVKMAARGLRVLAVAVGDAREPENLKLCGLFGIADPPRESAVEAVRLARLAGIKTVMITGDHPVTAEVIGRELGIVLPGESARDFIHARATAADKIAVIKKWKDRGEIVAMTGDGVNDAPALKEADVGVAMGKTGTEVTREAADLILLDDNFASLIEAVREGRSTFDNIRKTIIYLLSGNAAELFIMMGAALVGLAPPLLPLHLLWINLVTDGLPALTLVMDPVSSDVLNRPPRNPKESFLRRKDWVGILFSGVLEASIALGVYFHYSDFGTSVAQGRAFTVLVFCELLRAFSARSADKIFWEVGAFTNLRLLGTVLCSVFLQMLLHYVPFTRELFSLTTLSFWDAMVLLGLGLLPVSVLEIIKLLRRPVR